MIAEEPSELSWEAVKQVVDESGPAQRREVCLAFLKEHPRFGPALIFLGEALSDLSQYDEAEAAFQRALDHSPNEISHFAHRALGNLHKSLRDWPAAERFYQLAMVGREHDATDHIYLGACYARQGRFDEAEAQHRRGTECSEGCIDEAWLNLGLVLRAKCRYEEAAESFERALEIDPDYLAAAEALADVEKARVSLRRLGGRMSSKGLEVTWETVLEAIEFEEPAYLIEVCREHLRVRPEHGPTLHRLGDTLADLALHEEAEEALHRALARCPAEHAYQVHRSFGHLFKYQRRYSESEHHYRLALAVRGDGATDYIYLGECLALQGRHDEAEMVYRRGTECSEGFLDEAWLNLGLVLRAKQRYGEAADCFRTALKIDPDDVRATEALADVERTCEFLEGLEP